MKKSLIILVAISFLGLTAFVKTSFESWQGSASVTVSPEKPGFLNDPSCYQQYERAGSPTRDRVINVTGMSAISESSLKTELLNDIKSQMKCYEKMSTTVRYSITKEN